MSQELSLYNGTFLQLMEAPSQNTWSQEMLEVEYSLKLTKGLETLTLILDLWLVNRIHISVLQLQQLDKALILQL